MQFKRMIKKIFGNEFCHKLNLFRYSIFNFILELLPIQDEIILESNPDMACNCYEVYKYLIQQEVNKKYRLTWLVRDINKYADIKDHNVFFIEKFPRKFITKIKVYVRCNRAKISICCNMPLYKYKCSKKQINIYLDHGSPLKEMRTGSSPVELSCDYIISQADFFNEYIEQLYGIQQSQIITCGIPRNDQFYQKQRKINLIYEDIDSFDKVIAWVPTFRIDESGERIDCDYDFPLGIPIVYSTEDMLKLNTVLKKYNILVVFKPHPAQNLSVIKSLQLSNVRYLYNEQMLSCGVQTNEFLKDTDAMITDYSGIYYDYLLSNKPIAISLDDYKEYRQQQGFVIEEPLKVLVGEYLYNLNDLLKFIHDIANGYDAKKEERTYIKHLTNKYCDGNSTKRFYDFLKEKL